MGDKYQQMQDEMSRFEAEISGDTASPFRPVIGSATFGAVQQQLERGAPGLGPPGVGAVGMVERAYELTQMAPRIMFPTLPPPPPPPSMMIPASVQRLRPAGPPDGFQMQFMRPGPMPGPMSGPMPGPMAGPMPGPMPGPMGMPGPQLIPPPPPKPQPAILSAAPKLYKPKEEESEKMENRKRKRSPPPPPPKPDRSPSPPAPAPPAPSLAPPAPLDQAPKVKKEKKNRKVIRTAGGQTWEDVTLFEWPDDDFRMFCGDLGNDVTDELLTRTFSKYSSFQKARVVRDKRTNKSKGFGFVSFKDPGDFIKAMKEMDGCYVGSRPIKLRKSSWRNRSLDVVRKKEKEKAALLSLLMGGNKS